MPAEYEAKKRIGQRPPKIEPQKISIRRDPKESARIKKEWEDSHIPIRNSRNGM